MTEYSCRGAQAATRVTEFMAETLASLYGTPLTPERETEISRFMAQNRVGFLGDLDPTPNEVAYSCELDCMQCFGRVGLSVNGELSVIEVPPDCPDYEEMNAIRYEDAVKQLKES